MGQPFPDPVFTGPSITFPIGGVPCAIWAEDGVKEAWPEDGPWAQVTFKCPWYKRYTVLQYLRGFSTYLGNGKLVRVPPWGYPSSPNLRCMEIGEIRGLGKIRTEPSTGWLVYEWALIPAIFRVPTWGAFPQGAGTQYDPSGEAFTETRIKASGQVFTPPGGAYYFCTGLFAGPVPQSSVGQIQGQLEINITRKWLPWVPVDAAMTLIGSVNNSTLQLSDHTFDQGTLMFYSMESEPAKDGATNLVWDVTYTLIGAIRDWNKFLNPDGSWEKINTKADGSGTFPYPYFDYFLVLP